MSHMHTQKGYRCNFSKQVYRCQENEERFSFVIDFIFEKWWTDRLNIEPDEVTDEMLLEHYGDCVRNVFSHNRLNRNKDNIDDLEYEIKVGLDKWDKQIQEINLELGLRNNSKYVFFDESFGILNKIDNECKVLDLSIGKYDNFDIKSYLEQIGNCDVQIKNAKNKLEVISANIENKEIRNQERDTINEIKIKNFEINVENARNFLSEQKKKEKDELNIIDKCKEMDRIGMELKNLILQIDNDKSIIEKAWCTVYI